MRTAGIGVELFVDRADLRAGVFGLDHGPRQHFLIASLAEPEELLALLGLALALDHETPRAFAAPRRMRHAARTEEHLALADLHHLTALAFGLHVQLDVAVDLEEELLARLAMEIEPRVRPVQHQHEELAVMGEDAVGLVRRLIEMPVLLHPALEIGRGKRVHHRHADDSTFCDFAAPADGLI